MKTSPLLCINISNNEISITDMTSSLFPNGFQGTYTVNDDVLTMIAEDNEKEFIFRMVKTF